MGDKNKKILKLKSKQNNIKKEIQRIQKYIPYTLSFLLIVSLAIVFFYDYMIYNFFGNHFGFLAILISSIGIFSIFYIIKSSIKVKSLNNEIKVINSKLYKLMKLDFDKQ